MWRFSTLIFLSLLVFKPSFAESLNLGSATEIAEKRSPRMEFAQSAQNAASWKRIETYSGFLPSLSANAHYLFQKKYILTDVNLPGSTSAISIPQIYPTSNLAFVGEMPLFDGLSNIGKFRANLAYENSSKIHLNWTRFEVDREVALQFYKALSAQILKQVAETNLGTLKDHLKDVNLLKQNGVATRYDVLQVEVQVSEAESELLNAEDNVALSKNKISQILGEEIGDRELAGDLPVLSEKDFENFKEISAAHRPDIQALEQKIEGLHQDEIALQSHWFPKISLFGQYQMYNNRNDSAFDTDAYRSANQVGLAMTWHLFDGMSSMAKAAQKSEERIQAESLLRTSQLKASYDLNLWKRKFFYFHSVYQSREQDTERAKESLRLAREGRRVGARTNTDLLDAETELYRAQAAVVNAQMGMIESMIQFELASGQKIYDFN